MRFSTLISKVPDWLISSLSGVLMLAGGVWFAVTWATADHWPVPLVQQGWPSPALFLSGIWLYTVAK